MSYDIRIKKSVLKDLASLPEPYYSKIKDAIYGLAHQPSTGRM